MPLSCKTNSLAGSITKGWVGCLFFSAQTASIFCFLLWKVASRSSWDDEAGIRVVSRECLLFSITDWIMRPVCKIWPAVTKGGGFDNWLGWGTGIFNCSTELMVKCDKSGKLWKCRLDKMVRLKTLVTMTRRTTLVHFGIFFLMRSMCITKSTACLVYYDFSVQIIALCSLSRSRANMWESWTQLSSKFGTYCSSGAIIAPLWPHGEHVSVLLRRRERVAQIRLSAETESALLTLK